MLEEDFYRTYSKYLRDIYGEKVYKLPVKLGMGILLQGVVFSVEKKVVLLKIAMFLCLLKIKF